MQKENNYLLKKRRKISRSLVSLIKKGCAKAELYIYFIYILKFNNAIITTGFTTSSRI